MPRSRRVVETVRWALWVGLLLTITVNSFPFFPFNVGFGEAVVRPLSLFPLVGLVLVDLLPRVATRERLPGLAIPLLLFCVIGVVSTEIALLSPSLPFRNQTAITRAVRSVGTVAIGVAFYLETILMTKERGRRNASLRWLYAGLGLAAVLGGLQWSHLLIDWPGYSQLDFVQRLLSIRGLHPTRVSGPTYEPSWFADQLAVLALPLMFASLVTGYKSWVRFPGGKWFEPVMFVACAGLLAGTYSRGGLFSFGLALATLGSTLLITRRQAIVSWLGVSGYSPAHSLGRWARVVVRGAAVAIGGIAVILASRAIFIRNNYFTLLWVRLTQASSVMDYLKLVGAGPRLALAQAGLDTFASRPWLGVGLGQSGFFLLEHIPLWAIDRRSEIMLLLAATSYLFPNPKNLWVRLLAETGIVGMAAFLIWIGMIFAASVFLMGRADKTSRFLGSAGIMMCIAILAEGFSLDSFALPTMWVAFGFVTGAAWQALEGDSGRIGGRE